jgi:voltage-gated sodium channel
MIVFGVLIYDISFSKNIRLYMDSSMGMDSSFGTRAEGLSLDGHESEGARSIQSQKTASSMDGIDVLRNIDENGNTLDVDGTWIHSIVSDIRFKRVIMALILLDSALLGIATFDFVSNQPKTVRLFSFLNWSFLTFFTIEIILRIVNIRLSMLFSNGWLVFDLIIIALSWFSALYLVFRSFRIIRTLRLATRLNDLRTMALATQEVLPKISAVIFLVALSFYVFSIFFTDLFHDLHSKGHTKLDYFSSLDKTAFTLFQIMTLDQWSTIANEVQAVYPLSWMIFLPFVVLSTFFLLNFITAVIYEAIVCVHQKECDQLVRDPKFEELNLRMPYDAVQRLERKVDKLSEGIELLLDRHMRLQ